MSEIERLRDEVVSLQAMRDHFRKELGDDKLAARTRPPLSQLSRTQRRYFLEPWFTTLWVSSWAVAVVCFALAIWSPWTASFVLTAVLFTVIGLAAACAKALHQVANVSTEGQLLDKPSRRSNDGW